MRNILFALVAVLFTTKVFAETIPMIVTGSTGGGINAFAQLMAKDSEAGKYGNIKLDPIVPGSACKGFAVVGKQAKGSTFLTHYENYYQLVSKLKNNPACPFVSFEGAAPIVSKVGGLYLVVKTNGKGDNIANNGLDLNDFKNKKLKIGYSGSSTVEKEWHNQMNAKWGSDHIMVGYNGSSKMRAGMASEEVDAVWTSYRHFLRLMKVKKEYAILLKTVDQNKVSKSTPTLGDYLGDPKLTRAWLSTWYVFNDKNGIAKTIAASMKSDMASNTGNIGAYANKKKLVLEFDAETQTNMEKSYGWDQY